MDKMELGYDYGEIVSQRCHGPCGAMLALEMYARDINNKTTGRQRRCRECFKVYYNSNRDTIKAKVRRRQEAQHPRTLRVVIAPNVYQRLEATAGVRGMGRNQFAAYIVTSYVENVLDMEFEARLNGGEKE